MYGRKRKTTITKPKNGRYGKNKRFENNDGKWDSAGEWKRFVVLRDLEKKGIIRDLEVKSIYRFELNGVLIATLKPDFRYYIIGADDDVLVVDDYKGGLAVTRDFKMRIKMLKAFYGIDLLTFDEPTDISHIKRTMSQ